MLNPSYWHIVKAFYPAGNGYYIIEVLTVHLHTFHANRLSRVTYFHKSFNFKLVLPVCADIKLPRIKLKPEEQSVFSSLGESRISVLCCILLCVVSVQSVLLACACV